jgi:pimeloyl-ACP methyl ester carboxylesterase
VSGPRDDAFEGAIAVPGGRLWAQWAGQGSGVVLIHAGIADARMWDPQWDAVVEGHRAARYDCRGFYRTVTEAVPFSNRADVVAVMDAAGLDQAVVVGCSRGGAIALDTALEYPDRVSGLVWVCGGVSGAELDDTPEATAAFEREEALVEAKDWEAMADLDVEIWVDGLGQPVGRAPEPVRTLVKRMCLDSYTRELEEGEPIPLDPPAAGRLWELRIPVLAIVGELDLPATSAMAAMLVDGVPGARRIDLPDVAHLPSLERPAWFTETLGAFLDEVAAAG